MEIIVILTSLLFYWFPFAEAANSTYEPCDNCIERATPSILANVSLRLYPKETIDQYKSVLVDEVLDLCKSINASKPTVLYIFGWTESPFSISVQTVLNAYLKRQDHNIILANWQQIAANSYPYAADSVNGVGYTVATAVNKLVAADCLNSSSLHVVGHSLGAQTSGFVGRYLKFRLSRITGLDPAGPGYYSLIQELTSADAAFVDVIHTDAGVFGTEYNTGTVNFHPNGGGSPQPGCVSSGILANGCSHARSWAYFAESLLNENSFIGIECRSYLYFAWGLCSKNTQLIMGYATSTDASGDFYLQTNSASPWGRGANGGTYSELVARKNMPF